MTTDFLEIDPEISGQKYACLSFVSPETVLKNKELYLIKHFINHLNSELKLNYKDIADKYDDFKYTSEEKLSAQFDETNGFQTSVRGVKIKGVYGTKEEAEKRCARFQKMDTNFNVFIGPVGHWLPWDPSHKYLDNIEGQEYQDEQLNELVKSYQQNSVNRDIFYEERKQEAMKEALKLNEASDPWLDKREAEAEDDNTGKVIDDSIKEI
jgi:hypothetical protein